MSKDYNHLEIEEKWQKEWAEKKVFEAKDNSDKPKWYSLFEFNYPSGDGLHVGHVRTDTAMDIISRKRRMEGFNVLYPIGWDSFGLPTENYAIKTGKSPEQVTKENTDNFRRQIKSLGISVDWSREIDTSDPKYYKWTQWLFLKFLEHGLAYKARMNINWCPKDKIGLANEEVVNGCCERCGTPVEQREKEQWMLVITKYAERLDKDLDTVDYLPHIKLQQRNWIGRSEGAEVEFLISNFKFLNGEDSKIIVFTTRPETIFGAGFLALAPEHPWVTLAVDDKHIGILDNREEIKKYIGEVKNKTEIERMEEGKEKTGVELKGVKAVNPANGEEIPVWIADFILPQYGTGAVFGDAHDERDFQFAKKYSIPLKETVIPKTVDKHDPPREGVKTVERKAIQAIIINPKDAKVLTLKWKKLPWTTFITGGIDDAEDIVGAAKREILEETGYKNLKFVRHLGGPIESHFYANHKEENRKALFYCLVFELENEEKIDVSEKEKEIHEPHWMSWEEIEADKNTKSSEYDILKDRFFNPPHAWTGEGILIDSGKFSGMTTEEARKPITEFVGGKIVTKFKLRDWVFSRQRYWGEPIPVIFCEKCGVVPVPEKDLPVLLPKVEKYQPTDSGESPLANISEWVNTTCPKCGGPAKRETDTMPNWAGSSWYFLRYADPHNDTAFADAGKLKYWMPVDWYNGGMEHTTLHLLYSRFWNKFLFDIGLVPTSEPYKKRTSHGLILVKGGEKMSKSKGNVVNPDDIVKIYGADTLRTYEMFMGPFDQAIAWGEENIIGVRRFLERVWRVASKITDAPSELGLERVLHQTIKKVSADIETMSFNTAVSSMMILVNEFEKQEAVSKSDFEIFLKILSPFAPHIAEEIWHELGNTTLLVAEPWPQADEIKIKETEKVIVIQVDSKIRAQLLVSTNASEKEITDMARTLPALEKWISGKEVKKVIYVPGKLINFVI